MKIRPVISVEQNLKTKVQSEGEKRKYVEE